MSTPGTLTPRMKGGRAMSERTITAFVICLIGALVAWVVTVVAATFLGPVSSTVSGLFMAGAVLAVGVGIKQR